MTRLAPAVLILMLSALSIGCMEEASKVSFMERQAGGEQTRESFGPDSYSYEAVEGGSRYLWTRPGGLSPSHDDEALRFKEKIALLADQIEFTLSGSGHSARQIVLLPTTFVNLDDLGKTSTFGRLCAEELASELMARQFEVIEVRQSKELFILPRAGELALSRHFEELTQSYQANALLVGTYVSTAQQVVLNVRLVRNGDHTLAAAGTAIFNRLDNLFLNSLLVKESRAGFGPDVTAEGRPRVPVGVSGQFKETTLKE